MAKPSKEQLVLREFLAGISESERARIITCFRDQMAQQYAETQHQIVLAKKLSKKKKPKEESAS